MEVDILLQIRDALAGQILTHIVDDSHPKHVLRYGVYSKQRSYHQCGEPV